MASEVAQVPTLPFNEEGILQICHHQHHEHLGLFCTSHLSRSSLYIPKVVNIVFVCQEESSTCYMFVSTWELGHASHSHLLSIHLKWWREFSYTMLITWDNRGHQCTRPFTTCSSQELLRIPDWEFEHLVAISAHKHLCISCLRMLMGFMPYLDENLGE